MEADELQTIYAMVEESSKTNESVGQFVDEEVRSPAMISVINLGVLPNLASIVTACLQG